MDTLFFSKIIGIYFIIIGIAYLINPHYCKKVLHGITSLYGLSALCGTLGVIFGMIILLHHNLWVTYLEIVISLIGWLTLIIGFIFVFFPKSISHAGRKLQKHHNWIWLNLVLLIIGLFLAYMGFFNN